MKRKYDIVLYGASGFVGQLCCKYFKKNYPQLFWAMAGRSQSKLEQIKKENGLSCDVLVADGNDYEALLKITEQTKVILSTAGPFARYGSKLVEACVNSKTHYTDITGENHWTRMLIDKHFDKAAQEGTRIVPSCGYDSVPSDMGTFYAVTEFGKPVKIVEAYQAALGTASGGTLETMFDMAKIPDEFKGSFLTNPEGTVSQKQREESRSGFRVATKVPGVKGYTGMGLMAMTNAKVVRRSAGLMEKMNKPYAKDFVYREFGAYPNWFLSCCASFFLLTVFTLLQTPIRHLIRPLLYKPGEGPSPEFQEKGWFKTYLAATAEDGERRIYLLGGQGDPGYKSTAKLVCEAALALVDTKDLPGGESFGGVLTPATALGKPYLKRLEKAQITLKQLS